jgi:hypothetical protein
MAAASDYDGPPLTASALIAADDPRLCAAIVDRLTFGGNIIETGTESYRLAHTKAQAERATTQA